MMSPYKVSLFFSRKPATHTHTHAHTHTHTHTQTHMHTHTHTRAIIDKMLCINCFSKYATKRHTCSKNRRKHTKLASLNNIYI